MKMDMKSKNNKMAVWFVVNLGGLGMFVYGNVADASSLQLGLLNISVFLWWSVSIVALFGFSELIAEKIIDERDPHEELFGVPKTLDVSFDILALVTMVYFGFFFLGAFYFVHILGANVLKDNMNKYMDIKNKEYDAELKANSEKEANSEKNKSN